MSADGCWYFAYGSNMGRAVFIERYGMRPRALTEGWRVTLNVE